MTSDLNIISYFIYLPVMSLIIIKVGLVCYTNGLDWMLRLFGDEDFVHTVNKLLLVGYYLLNIGYVAISLRFWPDVLTHAELLEELTRMAGVILLILALLHFTNMAAIGLYYRRAAPQNKTTKTT
jgi:hypothetical protein